MGAGHRTVFDRRANAQFDAVKIAEVAGKAAIARTLGCHPIDRNPAD